MKNKMKEKDTNIFFTSDWHVGHANVIKFDERPFEDLMVMHRVLLNNYNASVGPEDICYFLGDMVMGGNEGRAELKRMLDLMNGTKVLVKGNHDFSNNTMYELGFDVVMNSASLVIAQELVTLTHCPLRGIKREDTSGFPGHEHENWHGETRLVHYSLENAGQFHLHGHLHSRPGLDKSAVKQGRQWDIGVPGNNYRPISIGQVESWIALTKLSESNV